MIKITIELLPLGNESKAETIGAMFITNDGAKSVLDEKHSYHVEIGPDNWTNSPKKLLEISGFERKKSIWSLIKLILNKDKSL